MLVGMLLYPFLKGAFLEAQLPAVLTRAFSLLAYTHTHILGYVIEALTLLCNSSIKTIQDSETAIQIDEMPSIADLSHIY